MILALKHKSLNHDVIVLRPLIKSEDKIDWRIDRTIQKTLKRLDSLVKLDTSRFDQGMTMGVGE